MKTDALRILAVEDNPADFRILSEHLRDGHLMDFEVVQAGTLQEALQLLSAGRFSVVLLDLNLPDSHGLESLEKVIGMRPMPPVIVLTGMESEEMGLLALSKNAQDYLVKGKINSDILIRSIRYAIERNRADEAVLQLNAELEKRAAELRDVNETLDAARIRALDLMNEAIEARRQADSDRNRLEAIMEALPVGVAILDEKGGNVRSNSSFERIWGSPRPETREMSDYAAYKAWWIDTDRPVEPGEWASAIAIRTGKSVVGQAMSIERFDGSRAFVLNSAAPVYNIEGKLDGCTVAMQDITRLIESEQAMRESEERYRSLMELSPSAIFVNRGGRIVMLNTAAQVLFGASAAEQMLGKTTYDFFHPDYHAIIEGRTKRLQAGEAVPIVEEKVIRLDGMVRDVEVASANIMDSEGPAIQVVMRDITQRKQMEDALRETRDYLDNLIDNANAPIIVWDPSFRITRFNRAFEGLTGLRVEQVIGKELDMLFPESSRNQSMSLIRAAVSGEHWEVVEIPILQTSGSIRTVLWNSANIHGKDGAVVSTIAQGQDITARKVTEEMLKWELSVNMALAELSETLISQDYTIKEISEKVLDFAKGLTGSEHGYAGVIDRDNPDHPDVAIFPSREAACHISATDNRIVFAANKDGSYDGLWGHALNTREPFFDNNPGIHTTAKGVPDGHMPINNFLSSPAVLGEELVGQIALANAPHEYEAHHLEAVKRMADLYALAIQRIHYENALVEANRSLEKKVLERSMKLYQINDQLITEIEERKQIEKELRKSEFKFRTVADFTYAGEYWVDALGNYLYVSPSVERISGYRPDEFMADKDLLAKIIYHEDCGKYETHMHDEFNDMEPKEIYFRIVRRDGAVRDIAHVCNPVFDESGEFIGRRASNRDVTEHQHAETKLREGQEVATALINTSTEPVLLIAEDGIILDANDEFSRRMNRKKGKLIGISMYDVIGQDIARSRRDKIKTVIEAGVAQRYEEKSVDSWYDTIIYPIRDDNGSINKMAIFSRDITETRRLQKEIMEISELERKRFGQAMHDSLGQKLTGLAFLAESLHQTMKNKSYPEQASMEEIVTMAMESVTHARNISKDLWTMRLESHDAVQVIEDVADETRSFYKIQCSLHTALTEPVDNNVVATNFYFIAKESIINAIKHGKADKIDIRFYDDDECVYLEIQDNGKGAKKEFMNTPGIGLRIMQYRAEILGGTLSAVPLKKGFRVFATMKKEFIKNYLT
jgi:PAS domain S-box-containing protein